MIRILLIGQDHATAQRLGLLCLERGIAVGISENVCEAVRVLATTPMSLVVADLARIRLGFPEQATLFERVAPGVPVVVTAPEDLPLETRVALEVAGFDVVADTATPEELLKSLR